MFYGNGSDIEKSAKKTDIEKTDDNSLMAKAMAPKSLTLINDNKNNDIYWLPQTCFKFS